MLEGNTLLVLWKRQTLEREFQRLHEQVMCSAAMFVTFQVCFIFVHIPVRTGKGDKNKTCTVTVRCRTQVWFECDRNLVYPMLASKTSLS